MWNRMPDMIFCTSEVLVPRASTQSLSRQRKLPGNILANGRGNDGILEAFKVEFTAVDEQYSVGLSLRSRSVSCDPYQRPLPKED